MQNKAQIFDIAVVGAGLVGLAAAVAMHMQGYRVALIDRQNPAKNATNSHDWDARIYAISPKNIAFLSELGVWQQLDATRIGQMQGMEIWADTSEAPLALSEDGFQPHGLGAIVEAGALTKVLLEKVVLLGIPTFFEVTTEHLTVSHKQTQINLKNAQNVPLTISADLLLAADGNQSWIREQGDFSVTRSAYAHHGLVANFKAEFPHENIARQWFLADEDDHVQVLAWLPLPDNLISIVWSASPTFTEKLLQLDAATLTKKMAETGNHLLGSFELVTPPAAFPLALQKVEPIFSQSVVLLGDAAHQVHPMAGQGVNLGFRDVEDLLEILKNKHAYQAINDPHLLKQFARKRKVDVAKVMLVTDGLYHLFDHSAEWVKKVRNWGFEATKHRLSKAFLVKQAAKL